MLVADRSGLIAISGRRKNDALKTLEGASPVHLLGFFCDPFEIVIFFNGKKLIVINELFIKMEGGSLMNVDSVH